MWPITLLILLSCVGGSLQQGQPVKMSFKPPPVDEEMEHSQHMPTTMDCEACIGIAYQLEEGLKKMHQTKYPKNKLKPESTLIETVDNICMQKVFEGYGVKGIGGESKLSGPGLGAEEEAGMMMGGGRWPARMAQRCNEYRGELDDMVMYDMVINRKKLAFELCYSEFSQKLQSCRDGRDRSLKFKKGGGMNVTPVDESELTNTGDDSDYDDEDEEDDHDEL